MEVKATSAATAASAVTTTPATATDEIYSDCVVVNQVNKLYETIKESSFVTLDSLDEEEADSDESGYVEAPPKSLLDINNDSSSDKFNDNDNDNDLSSKMNIKSDHHYFITTEENEKSSEKVNDNSKNIIISNNTCDKIQEQYQDSISRHKDREIVDFITSPISETIKKLANASLKNSKSIELSSSNCLKALNTFRNTKSFDGTKTTINYDDEPSPSLDQRKQLLAKQGVKV